MKFESLIPILYSQDVEKSIENYIEKLAFENQWIWDDEKTFGCVRVNCIDIFFCKMDQGHPGTWMAINVDNVMNTTKSLSPKVHTFYRSPQICHGICGKCLCGIRMAISYDLVKRSGKIKADIIHVLV